MDSELRNRKSKVYNSFRGALHIAMGGIYIVISIATVYFKAFITVALSTAVAYIVGGLFLLYGVFRVWRGWMDMRRR